MRVWFWRPRLPGQGQIPRGATEVQRGQLLLLSGSITHGGGGGATGKKEADTFFFIYFFLYLFHKFDSISPRSLAILCSTYDAFLCVNSTVHCEKQASSARPSQCTTAHHTQGVKHCCFPEDTWKSTWVQRWFKELVQLLWLSREKFIAKAKQKGFSPDTRKEAPAGQYLPGSKDNSLIEKAVSSGKPALLYQGFLKQQIWKVRQRLGNLCLAHFPSAGRRRQGSIYSQVRIIFEI